MENRQQAKIAFPKRETCKQIINTQKDFTFLVIKKREVKPHEVLLCSQLKAKIVTNKQTNNQKTKNVEQPEFWFIVRV